MTAVVNRRSDPTTLDSQYDRAAQRLHRNWLVIDRARALVKNLRAENDALMNHLERLAVAREERDLLKAKAS